jgi:peptidoglycan/LPS O-acetylase OafA/YrhL
MTFEPGERLHALDAVRAFALILGVFLHATMSFLPGQQLWVVADVERSQAMGGTFFLLHIFRMSLFFFVAGLFAHLSLQKRGTRGFVIDRLKRVGVPLVAGWPILFALIIAVARSPRRLRRPTLQAFFSRSRICGSCMCCCGCTRSHSACAGSFCSSIAAARCKRESIASCS